MDFSSGLATQTSGGGGGVKVGLREGRGGKGREVCEVGGRGEGKGGGLRRQGEEGPHTGTYGGKWSVMRHCQELTKQWSSLHTYVRHNTLYRHGLSIATMLYTYTHTHTRVAIIYMYLLLILCWIRGPGAHADRRKVGFTSPCSAHLQGPAASLRQAGPEQCQTPAASLPAA